MDDQEKTLLIELLKLSAYKQIPYTQSQLKKMSLEKLEEVLQEYKLKELDTLNDTQADVAIVEIEEYSKSFNLIKKESKLAKKLQDRKLFKRDLKSLVSWITPLLPYVGILEGAVVYGLEVIDKLAEKTTKVKDSVPKNKNDDTSSQTQKRSQQGTSASESDTNED